MTCVAARRHQFWWGWPAWAGSEPQLNAWHNCHWGKTERDLGRECQEASPRQPLLAQRQFHQQTRPHGAQPRAHQLPRHQHGQLSLHRRSHQDVQTANSWHLSVSIHRAEWHWSSGHQQQRHLLVQSIKLLKGHHRCESGHDRQEVQIVVYIRYMLL